MQDIVAQSLNDVCVQVIQNYLSLPGFNLYEKEEFTFILYQRCLQENITEPESAIKRIGLNIYSDGLCQAITSNDDLSLRERGYSELSNYLYRMAYNFYLRQSLEMKEVINRAQEATQISLERVYTHIDSLKSPGGFLKWCGVILRNICLQDVQKNKPEIPLDDQENDASAVYMDDENIHLDQQIDHDCVQAAIARLKKEYQQVITFSYFTHKSDDEKMSDDEIAARLKITVGNLYTIRSRAISALRKDILLIRCLQDEM